MSSLLPNKAYQEATEWLFSQFPSYQLIGSKAYKPTLRNSQTIAKLLGNPHSNLKFVHVAGSNGKGSVSSMLASILTESGYKVGLFTSPHIKDFRERIRVNGKSISKNEVVTFVQKIQRQELDFDPSFFEITFGMALEHFQEKCCNICIIETGLGGRLDATNIITPLISIITNISLEHTQILGETIEEIALEKSGIIKSGIPVVLGKMNPTAQEVLFQEARTKSSPFHLSNRDSVPQFDLPLQGMHQIENLQTVLKTLDLLVDMNFKTIDLSIQRGLNALYVNSGLTGRLQIISRDPLIIYDVSHNPDGIKTSLETITELNKGRLHIIYGSSSDKDIPEILSLFPENTNFYFTEFSNDRCAKLLEFRRLTTDEKFEKAKYFESPLGALETAISEAMVMDTIIVLGSFYLISEFS